MKDEQTTRECELCAPDGTIGLPSGNGRMLCPVSLGTKPPPHPAAVWMIAVELGFVGGLAASTLA